MSFETDKQTLDDLNLLGKYKNNSVYSLYVGTITRGGERKMEDMFLHPLTDAKSINERSAVFRYFRDHDFGRGLLFGCHDQRPRHGHYGFFCGSCDGGRGNLYAVCGGLGHALPPSSEK